MKIRFAVMPLFPTNIPTMIIEGPVLPNVGDEIDFESVFPSTVHKILYYPTQQTLDKYNIEIKLDAIVYIVR